MAALLCLTCAVIQQEVAGQKLALMFRWSAISTGGTMNGRCTFHVPTATAQVSFLTLPSTDHKVKEEGTGCKKGDKKRWGHGPCTPGQGITHLYCQPVRAHVSGRAGRAHVAACVGDSPVDHNSEGC